jgi:hypothetical protein
MLATAAQRSQKTLRKSAAAFIAKRPRPSNIMPQLSVTPRRDTANMTE